MKIASHYYLPELSSGFLFSPSLAQSDFFVLSSFVSCACVYSEYGTAGKLGAVGCKPVLAGSGGIARSAVAVFVARRSVCLETRGRHEWALSGLHS